MKPDVLKQIKEIDAERAKMMQQQNANGPIMLQQPGKEPVALSSQDVVNMIQQQQQQINSMSDYIKQLEMSKNVNGSPFMPMQSPFIQPSPFVQPFSNTSELEKENNELKEKYNSIYNEIQRYKVMIESQKSTIEKLKKSSNTEHVEKRVKFK
jgi:hypothetical protein